MIQGWCEKLGYIVHALGHTLGFWHEQSRPDRDEYITVNTTNIMDGRQYNFAKVLENKIDYQNSTYDFGSIMQPSLYAFTKRRACDISSCQTMVLKNVVEYQHQGSPQVGQRQGPSERDIEEANHLYSCPGRGIRGMFYFKLMLGKFEHDYGSTSNTYVKIIIVYSNGTESTHQSSPKRAANELAWNEMIISVKGDLQFFRISTWNTDSGNVQQITMSETFLVHPGTHQNLRNCDNRNCGTYVLFEYSIIPDSKTARKQSSAMQSDLIFVCHFIPCWLLTSKSLFQL